MSPPRIDRTGRTEGTRAWNVCHGSRRQQNSHIVRTLDEPADTAGKKQKREQQQKKKTRGGRVQPEESFAALTRHGVEVEAGGLIAAHAADPRSVAVELLRSNHRRRHRHGLHHCRGGTRRTEGDVSGATVQRVALPPLLGSLYLPGSERKQVPGPLAYLARGNDGRALNHSGQRLPHPGVRERAPTHTHTHLLFEQNTCWRATSMTEAVFY